MSQWKHYVIRFEHKDGSQFTSEEIKKCKQKFLEGWQPITEKTQHWSLVIEHKYGEEDKEKRHSGRCGHLHIACKKWKGAPCPKFIREFCRGLGLRLYEHSVYSILRFAKYLLQGNGRQILHEAGAGRPDGLQDRLSAVHKRQEDYGYDIGSESEGDEDYRATCQEDREDGAGKARPRQTKAVYKATGKYEEELVKVQTIKDLLLKYRCKDEANLKRKMNEKEHTIFKEIMFSTREWSKIWSTGREEAMTSIQDRWWDDVLETLPDDREAYSPPVMSVNKSIKVLTQILDKQGWGMEQRKQFVCDVYSVMNNNILRKKRNTLYMIGKTSAGKTLIATSLEISKIFSFNSGEYNSRTSDFHFEDMSTACICILNEPQIESGKVDKFKIILEGGAFDTNVKFKSKSRVEGVPCIVTTNHEIYRYAPEAAEPFEERLYRWKFTTKLSGCDITGGLHPKMWLKIIKYYDLNKEVFKDDSDEEFDISKLAGPGVEPPREYEQLDSDTESENSMKLDLSEAADLKCTLVAITKIDYEEWETDIEPEDTLYQDNGEHWSLKRPDFEKESDLPESRNSAWWHAFLRGSCNSELYRHYLTVYYGAYDVYYKYHDSLESGTEEDDEVIKRYVALFREHAEFADMESYEYYVKRVGTWTKGAGGIVQSASRLDTRGRLCQFISGCLRTLDQFRQRVLDVCGDEEPPAAYEGIDDERECRSRVLNELARTRKYFLSQALDDGWQYGSRKRGHDQDNGPESRVRDRDESQAKKFKRINQGRAKHLGQLVNTLRQLDEGETPLFLCCCGYWLCTSQKDLIAISGHQSCESGWIGSNVIYDIGQETSECEHGWIIESIDKTRLP